MSTLYEDINGLVKQRLTKAYETGETVNFAEWSSEIAQSLADFVVCGCEPLDQAKLISYTFEELGRFIRERMDHLVEPPAGSQDVVQ
jgi:hypothetical protein